METISVVIPAYNEEKRLPKTLESWRIFLQDNIVGFKIVEIIVVDDGSSDNTVEILNSFSKLLPIKIIQITPNQGKGFALKNGVNESIGDLIYIYDADCAVEPIEIKKLLFEIKNTDIVIGSRVAKGANTKMTTSRRFIGVCFHFLCAPLIPKIKDASCGAKIFRKAAAKKIFDIQKIKRFAYDIEILWLAKRLNFSIKEVGITWREVEGSKVKIFGDSIEMFVSVLSLYKKNFNSSLE